MDTSIDQNVMQHVHTLSVAEWGRIAAPLSEGDVQALKFPSSPYVTAVQVSSDDTLKVSQIVGKVEAVSPGLGEMLLREHARLLFGRYELSGAYLALAHTVRIADLDERSLRRIVLAVNHSALRMHLTLNGAEVLDED